MLVICGKITPITDERFSSANRLEVFNLFTKRFIYEIQPILFNEMP